MENKIVVNGVEYVRANSISTQAQSSDGLPYVIVRTYSAGVFAGYLKKRDGKEATVINARRLWKWVGAATLSQLSQEGVKNPKECLFPCEIPSVELTEVTEVLPATEAAKASIAGVKVWRM